jgi:c-di-GMP-binding flagellar brake protein YcgR
MEESDMDERRKLERFDLNAPARIQVELESGRKEELNLTTKDVSSGGAFLYSEERVPEGANVKLEFLISMEALRSLVGEKGRVKVKVNGKVIRVDEDGIAIRFDSKYKITALDSNHY